MFCANCGQANDDNAYKCVACGTVLQGSSSSAAAATPPPVPPPVRVPYRSEARAYVPNHLVWAILATLFCCLPSGIVAIIYAAQVDGKVAAGDIAGAEAASRTAVTWCWVSAGLGLAVGVLYFLGIMASIASHHH